VEVSTAKLSIKDFSLNRKEENMYRQLNVKKKSRPLHRDM